MLDEPALNEYVATLDADQAEAIRAVRNLAFAADPDLVEVVDTGKWFRGMLTYNTPAGIFLYALGSRPDGFTSFHMMVYYASPDLQQRHGDALKRFLTGKSCIKFRHYADLPDAAIRDIVACSRKGVEAAMAARMPRVASPESADTDGSAFCGGRRDFMQTWESRSHTAGPIAAAWQ